MEAAGKWANIWLTPVREPWAKHWTSCTWEGPTRWDYAHVVFREGFSLFLFSWMPERAETKCRSAKQTFKFCEELNPRLGSFPFCATCLCAGASAAENYRCSSKQTNSFVQSNSSVYTFYNDAPPVLDYIKGYGHTKGTAWLLHISLLLSSSQNNTKRSTVQRAWTESTCLSSTFAFQPQTWTMHRQVCGSLSDYYTCTAQGYCSSIALKVSGCRTASLTSLHSPREATVTLRPGKSTGRRPSVWPTDMTSSSV